MKLNMGIIDRGLRVLVAIFVGVLYAMGVIEGTIAYVAIAFSIVFLLTSAVGFCPLYLPFRLSTKKEN
jgi:hypothetical protein